MLLSRLPILQFSGYHGTKVIDEISYSNLFNVISSFVDWIESSVNPAPRRRFHPAVQQQVLDHSDTWSKPVLPVNSVQLRPTNHFSVPRDQNIIVKPKRTIRLRPEQSIRLTPEQPIRLRPKQPIRLETGQIYQRRPSQESETNKIVGSRPIQDTKFKTEQNILFEKEQDVKLNQEKLNWYSGSLDDSSWYNPDPENTVKPGQNTWPDQSSWFNPEWDNNLYSTWDGTEQSTWYDSERSTWNRPKQSIWYRPGEHNSVINDRNLWSVLDSENNRRRGVRLTKGRLRFPRDQK